MIHPALAPLSDRLFRAEVLLRRIDHALARSHRERLDVVADMAADAECPVLDLLNAEAPLLYPVLDGHPDPRAGRIVGDLRRREQVLRNAHAASLHLVATGADPSPALMALRDALAAHVKELRETALPWIQANVPEGRLEELQVEHARIAAAQQPPRERRP